MINWLAIRNAGRRCALLTGFCSGWLLTLGGPWQAAQAATCSPPGLATPAVAAPHVQHLRGYRYAFNSPLRLALDHDGALYIADPRRGEISVRAADGRIIHVQPGLGQPGALAVDAGGHIYVGDVVSGAVTLYDPQWQPLLSFGAAAISQIADLALDPGRSRVYVSDSEGHRVHVFSTSGERLFEIGGAGDGDGLFQYPSGIFHDATRDELLVSDQFGYRVQVFDADGLFKYCIGGSSARPGGFFQRGRLLAAPQGLWADQLGRVYVADSYEGRVQVLDRDGRLLVSVGRFGQGPGELRIPSDVVLDSGGRLYVASSNNARIEMFGIDAYSDPELYLPALLTASPGIIGAGDDGSLTLRARVPGARLGDIALDSLRLGSVAPRSIARVEPGVDGVPHIEAVFELADLRPLLPPSGPAQLVLEASAGALTVHGIASLEIVSSDDDGDGVDDGLDRCPDTIAGEIVDADGCSLAQACPCTDTDGHGEHVRCVAREARRFVELGLIDHDSRRQMLRAAARSDCGKGRKRHRRGHDRDDDETHNHDDDDRERRDVRQRQHDHDVGHEEHHKNHPGDDGQGDHKRRGDKR